MTTSHPRPEANLTPHEAARAVPQRVEFSTVGERIVGHLFTPSSSSEPRPAVVIGGSMTSVKEMMADSYAQEMAVRGFVALALDYRHYGESDGAPRQYEDQEDKAADISAAVEHLSGRPDVDPEGIVGLGVCTSGATMLYAANREPRLRAVASVAGHLASPPVTPLIYGGDEGVATRLEEARAARKRWEKDRVTDMVQAYSNVNPTASHPGPMEYYMDQRRGGGVPQWLNGFAVMSWEPWLALDAVAEAGRCSTPTVVFHTDDCALPEQARRVYDALLGPKQLVWTNGAHFDFYDDPTHITEAVDAVVAFFRKQGISAT